MTDKKPTTDDEGAKVISMHITTGGWEKGGEAHFTMRWDCDETPAEVQALFDRFLKGD